MILGSVGLGLLNDLLQPETATANPQALYGRRYVQCPNGHVDIVTGATKENGSVTIMCPNGHPNVIALHSGDELTSYECRKDGMECESRGWEKCSFATWT